MAHAEPKETRKPMVNGSASTSKAAFDAIKRFEGPAKGIILRTKEVKRIPKSSYKPANLIGSETCFRPNSMESLT